ncbi:uncharacterized protein LOC103970329 [Musa acuminata AAA Group]|uniref:uncharacterized protein LOC103970329 n=1 Tax=Musa acuminata AAA Group TaxID=214697 RepID=UPI0031D4D353
MMPEGGRGEDAESGFVAYFKRTLWFSFCTFAVSSGSLLQILPGDKDLAAHANTAILKSCILFNMFTIISSIILMFFSFIISYTQRRMITRFQLRVGTSIFISSVVLLVLTTYLFMLILKKPYMLAMVPLLLLLGITLVVLLRGGTLRHEIHGEDDAISQAQESKLLNLSSYVTAITSGGIISTVIAYMKNFTSSAYHSRLELSVVLLFINNIIGFFAMLLLLFTLMLSYSAARRKGLIAIASFSTYASFVLSMLLTLMIASESLALPHVLSTMFFAVGGVLCYHLPRRERGMQEDEVVQLEDIWKTVGTFAFLLMMVVRPLHLGSEAFAIKSFMFLCSSAFLFIQSQMLMAALRPADGGRLNIKIIFGLVGALLVGAMLSVIFI